MAKVSLNQAAKDTGVSLPTLSRWRKNGKISADKTDNGGYLLDTSEYDRIRELKNQSSNMKPLMEDNTLNLAIPNEIGMLQREIEVLRERMTEKEAAILDLRQERDDWKEQAKKLLLQAPEKPVEKRKGFFATLIGKSS